MSEPMISSLEEALLLLNKWQSESTRIVLLQTFMCPPAQDSPLLSGVMSRTTGRIAAIEEASGTFTFVSDNDDFVMVSPTGCTFGYNASVPLPPKLQAVLPAKWDSFLYITFPNDIRLVIFAI